MIELCVFNYSKVSKGIRGRLWREKSGSPHLIVIVSKHLAHGGAASYSKKYLLARCFAYEHKNVEGMQQFDYIYIICMSGITYYSRLLYGEGCRDVSVKLFPEGNVAVAV
jgi:hypothetical protein